jgi:hypothetical protein
MASERASAHQREAPLAAQLQHEVVLLVVVQRRRGAVAAEPQVAALRSAGGVHAAQPLRRSDG